MALIDRGVAAGGVMALMVQLSGPTPLGLVVSGSVQLGLAHQQAHRFARRWWIKRLRRNELIEAFNQIQALGA